MPLKILPPARDDLNGIREYIAKDNPIRALSLVEELEQACYQLADMPKSAPRRPMLGPDIRMRPVGNYIIYYRPVSDGVEIIRVIHAARDSGAQNFYQ